MSIQSWWRKKVFRSRVTQPTSSQENSEQKDLREFIYLDEVSLRSLLSSQKGEVMESISEATTMDQEANVAASIGVTPGFITKADVTSRFQTANSSTLQTSRKSTVQSWFREFHDIDDLRIIEPVSEPAPVSDEAKLGSVTDLKLVARAPELQRGKLVELRVRLAADPVFQLATMVTEFTDMAKESPKTFMSGNSSDTTLRQIGPINKILQKLLAGLVPIRAQAIDYVVAKVNGVEAIVHEELIKGMDIETRPLEIVGVTEHEAYWKDLRRVLFSNAEFTVMARISRTGLHDSWTPVKLADLFRQVAPDLVDQISLASRTSLAEAVSTSSANGLEHKLKQALTSYSENLISELGSTLTQEETEHLSQRIKELSSCAGTVAGQRSAFATIDDEVFQILNHRLEPVRALELRKVARNTSGLPLFPSLVEGTTTLSTQTPGAPIDQGAPQPRLLDVEVVAIYW